MPHFLNHTPKVKALFRQLIRTNQFKIICTSSKYSEPVKKQIEPKSKLNYNIDPMQKWLTF